MQIRPIRHDKGWGYEDWVVNTDLYCGKVLVVSSGKKCSLHYHKTKTETMLIVEGSILFEFRLQTESHLSSLILTKGDVFHIEPGLLHRFTGLEDSVIHEFSTQHHDEDSYRVENGD
jgi:mannose-6-phosphate isomerase-like protein (cupin superfamily)